MRKKNEELIRTILTAVFFLIAMIGAAGIDSENMIPAIVLLAVGAAGLVVEVRYWRRVYGY